MASAASAKRSEKWIPPLPQGWEARYDEENKAYFFIDHAHQKTQWEDPRFHKPAPQAQPQTQVTSAAAAASSLGHVRGPEKSRGAIALTDLKPRLQPKNQSQSSRSTVREANFSNEVDAAVVNKLKAEFPKATKELIIDMLALCHNSERETREQLNDLGFLANNSKGKNASHASPHRNTSAGAAATNKSPDKRVLSPTSSTGPTSKEQVSETDKKKMLSYVKGLFPRLDQDIIRMASNECHYNLDEVKALLTAWEKRTENNEQARADSARSASSSVSSSVPSVRSFSPTPGSLEPVGLEDNVAQMPKSLGNSQPVTHPPSQSTTPKRSTGSASLTHSLIQGARGDDMSSSKSSSSHHARAKQVTIPRQPATTSQPAVITSQPAKVTSQCRTEPKGPDASLRKGPDRTLLTSDYTQANGPDKSLRAGPDRSLFTGPQGAVGPDVSLRCGPQSALLQENRNNSITSPSGVIF